MDIDIEFVAYSTVWFTGIILMLVLFLVTVGNKLAPAGNVKININDGKKEIILSPGTDLLSALANENIFLPSACGGGGTCAMCKAIVTDGGGEILPTETGHIGKKDQKLGMRLACQVKVKQDMKIEVEDDVLEIKKFEGIVRSNKNVATFIKEFIVDLPEGVDLNFKAGGYIQIDVPEYDIDFGRDFEIEDEYRGDWDHFKFFDIKHKNTTPIFRAYSMANHPAEGNCVMLNIRIATPPPPLNGKAFPPGLCSTYVFSKKPGDKVTISGPFGEFFAKDTPREMCYIGGGAGMAPMRSHIFDLFHTKNTNRIVNFWYGARSVREMFYDDDFKGIEDKWSNFKYHVALSNALESDNWTGFTGFIHEVVRDEYLLKHKDPQEIEYYLCGPPMMISAVSKMLYDLGVEEDMIDFDEF
ncbi:MAG: NADH:ubiquinone reductase (Na(+)-transporting) subunit F [Planctomycetota bacterium]|nr:MAG: NADH:ubiquinone reductase (Na(+)-transporting) subunit F [Planctomycetota bacterium]